MSTKEIHQMNRSEKRPFAVDFGENTAGQTTGKIPAGDTILSAVVVVEDKPTDATDPTIGTVTINSTSEIVNDRTCSAGEAVLFAVTFGSTQLFGTYKFKITATTTGGYVLVDSVRVVCSAV